MKVPKLLVAASIVLASAQALCADTPAPVPDLDLTVQFYSKTHTPQGALRETRYEETMIRRGQHVWVMRVLPRLAASPPLKTPPGASLNGRQVHVIHPVSRPQDVAGAQQNSLVMARHVVIDHGKLRVEYVFQNSRELIVVPPAEYADLKLNGSWPTSFYLIEPQRVTAMPLSQQASEVAGARWHEQVKDGVFRRVLWDEARQLPLIVEVGDTAATFFNRIELKPQATLSAARPWQDLSSYTQRAYADFAN